MLSNGSKWIKNLIKILDKNLDKNPLLKSTIRNLKKELK